MTTLYVVFMTAHFTLSLPFAQPLDIIAAPSIQCPADPGQMYLDQTQEVTQ